MSELIHDLANADVLRWVNVGAACLVVSLLVAGTMLRWESMPLRIRRLMPWIIFTYVVIAYSNAEVAITENAPPGLRVVLTALNLIGLIVALLFDFTEVEYGYHKKKK